MVCGLFIYFHSKKILPKQIPTYECFCHEILFFNLFEPYEPLGRVLIDVKVCGHVLNGVLTGLNIYPANVTNIL